MNTPPVSTAIVGGASARHADRSSSESTAAAGGFAALFAQLEPTDAQGEFSPPVFVADVSTLHREDTAPEEGPDPTLLAALGLSPLPPLPIAHGLAASGLSAWTSPLTGSGSTPSVEAAAAASARPLAAALASAIPAAVPTPLASPAEPLPLLDYGNPASAGRSSLQNALFEHPVRSGYTGS
jgi:hypothetical protein